jgi:hypothetical protein
MFGGYNAHVNMIPPAYKPKKKFMQLAIAEAKRARDRGDYAVGAVVTRLIGEREVVIASAGNRVKTSGFVTAPLKKGVCAPNQRLPVCVFAQPRAVVT